MPWLALLLAAACSLGGDDGETVTDCSVLSIDACAASEACFLVQSQPLVRPKTGGELCVDFAHDPVPQACMDADLACTQAETYAAPPEDPSTCWWFPNGCIPDGWVPCDLGALEACPGR